MQLNTFFSYFNRVSLRVYRVTSNRHATNFQRNFPSKVKTSLFTSFRFTQFSPSLSLPFFLSFNINSCWKSMSPSPPIWIKYNVWVFHQLEGKSIYRKNREKREEKLSRKSRSEKNWKTWKVFFAIADREYAFVYVSFLYVQPSTNIGTEKCQHCEDKKHQRDEEKTSSWWCRLKLTLFSILSPWSRRDKKCFPQIWIGRWMN